MQDPDYNCSQSDSDSGNAGEDANFKNVLLITGPVGVTIAILVYCIMCLLLVFFFCEFSSRSIVIGIYHTFSSFAEIVYF